VVYRFRDGRRTSQAAVARWESYYPGEQLGAMWKRMPEVMLAKCAEALAFRKLLPRRFADVYAAEEMAQAAAVVDAPAQLTARERVSELRAQREAAEQGADAQEPAEPVQCEAEHAELGRCRREAGQEGNHAASSKETWAEP
jgi:hypothetical protein